MGARVSVRRLPVRPDLEQLKRQAKELLRALHHGEPEALAEYREHHPHPGDPAAAKLADAQLVLARCYQAPSWPRLVQACRLANAIWRDDAETVQELVTRNPAMLTEPAIIRRDSHWGPPLSYAANLGRDRIIRMLHALGATDLAYARDRAALQGQIGTVRMLHEMLGQPRPPAASLAGPAYTLSAAGTEVLLELGAPVLGPDGRRLAPVDVVLETDSRKPDEKHRILEMYAARGVEMPDTPPLAVHRGRLDLLEKHLRRDPRQLRRTYAFREIFPPELGCHEDPLPTHGTPLSGATLLHMAVDYDELEIARWLLDRGMNVDAKAELDRDGFGGHTALFATVVSQPAFWMNHLGKPREAPFAQLLLERGANPNARASLRKQLHPGYGEDGTHEYRDVTPLAWGRRFHRPIFVSEPAMQLIAERGGRE